MKRVFTVTQIDSRPTCYPAFQAGGGVLASFPGSAVCVHWTHGPAGPRGVLLSNASALADVKSRDSRPGRGGERSPLVTSAGWS